LFAFSRPSANISCIFRKRTNSTIYKNYSEIRKNWATSDCHWISRKTIAVTKEVAERAWNLTLSYVTHFGRRSNFPHYIEIEISLLTKSRPPGGHKQTNNNYDWYTTTIHQTKYSRWNINNCGAGTLRQERRYMHINVHTLTHIYTRVGGGGGGGGWERTYTYIRWFITNLTLSRCQKE
jgi:hypothetical protein